MLSFCWLIAYRGGIQTLHQLLLPVLLVLAVGAAFGARFAARTSIAIGYLIFAIPIWSVVNGTLQQMTIVATDLMLRLTGITASVTGNLVILPVGVFEIAGGCSGLHYFIVALAVAALYGIVNDCSFRDRLKLLILGMSVAVLSNCIRVYGVILAGYLTDMNHYLVRVEHASFGWTLFAIALAAFFLLGRRWTSPPAEAVAEATHSADHTHAVQKGMAMAVLAMCVAPVMSFVVPLRAAEITEGTLLQSDVPGWAGPFPSSASRWRPVFTGYDAMVRGEYSNTDVRLEVVSVAYAHQQQGRELVGYGNSIAGDFSVVSSAKVDAGLANELITHERESSSVIWFFYEIGDFTTADSFVAQAYYGAATLLGAPLSRVVAVRARCELASCDAARSALHGFVSSYQSVVRSTTAPRDIT